MAGSNRANGTSFEHDLCITLSYHGFWAHNLAQNRQGQPFDVLAARNGKTYAIDCKQCKKDRFPLNRVEENQRSSMILWEDTGNGDGWFALEMSDGAVFMLTAQRMQIAAETTRALSKADIEAIGIPLDEWVARCA